MDILLGYATYLALCAVVALFFIWGFFVARSRGRSGLMWGLACALTWVVGIAILYSLGENRPAIAADRRASLAEDPSEAATTNEEFADDSEDAGAQAARSNGAERDEDRRWRYLAEYHPEVRKALSAVSLLGSPAVDELKLAHLALNDPDLLPAIVQRLTERFGRVPPPMRNGAATHSAEMAAAAGAENTDDDDDPLILDNPTSRPNGRQQPSRQPASAPARVTHPVNPARSSTPTSKPAEPASVSAKPPALPEQRDAGTTNPPASAINGAASRTTEADTEISLEDDADPVILAGPAVSAPDRMNGTKTKAAPVDGPAVSKADQPAAASIQLPSSERTTVTPADLQGARFVDTYKGVHLFALTDGRVFVDRHEARASLALARDYVDQLGTTRQPGA